MSTEEKSRRPLWLRPGCILPVIAVVVILIGAGWFYLSIYQGRDISRFTGKPVQIRLPECVTKADQVLSVSFHELPSGETVKDVTYTCEGKVFSHEYNDFGILQGSIEWVINQPAGLRP